MAMKDKQKIDFNFFFILAKCQIMRLRNPNIEDTDFSLFG